MTDIFYPEQLPVPLKADFGLEAVSPFRGTPRLSGRKRYRRLYTSVPTSAPVTWAFKTDVEARLFEAWFRDALSDGVAWFYMRLKTPMGVKPYKCHFQDMYKGPYLISGNKWKFTADLDLWERPIMPPGWGNYPEYIMGADLIDYAANRDWPESEDG